MYDILGLISIINLLAIVGLIAFLTSTGKLDGERVRQVSEILREEADSETVAASQPATEAQSPEASQRRIARDEKQEELLRRRDQRARKELRDQERLVRSLMLNLVSEQEAIDSREQTLAESQRKLKNLEEDKGFKTTLAQLSNIKADQSKTLLKEMKEVDVVRYLSEMEVDVAKKIIEKCKEPEELEWIGRILEKIRGNGSHLAEAEMLGQVTAKDK
jgi:hypothetical protein